MNRRRTIFLTGLLLMLLAAVAGCKRRSDLPASEQTAVTVKDGFLHVSWTPVAGADCYYVYRIREGDESYGYWGVTKQTQLSDETIETSARYAYQIFAAKTDGKEYARADTSAVTAYACMLTAPKLNGIVMSQTGCTISWEPIEIATEYEVSRGESAEGPFTLLGRTREHTFIDVEASAKKGHYYQVRARLSADGLQSESAATTSPCSLTTLEGVRALRVSKRVALIHWEAQPDTLRYTVYRAESPNGSYLAVGETDQHLFRDHSLTSAYKTVYYAVQSCADVNGQINRSLSSDACVAMMPELVRAVPVIMYHDFITAEERKSGMVFDAYAIDPAEFEQDLQYLSQSGYHTVQLSELAAYIDKNTPLPENPIVLTIDDGTLGVYRHAYPLLQKYGMKAVVAVIGERIDAADKVTNWAADGKPYCSWEELGEMGHSGRMEILPHGYYLHVYPNVSDAGFSQLKNESMTAYVQRLKNDLLPLNEKIEQYTGERPLGVAYPYSLWSENGNIALQEVGYRFTLSGDTARSMKLNYFVDRLNPALQDTMLARMVRVTGKSLEESLTHAFTADSY